MAQVLHNIQAPWEVPVTRGTFEPWSVMSSVRGGESVDTFEAELWLGLLRCPRGAELGPWLVPLAGGAAEKPEQEAEYSAALGFRVLQLS